MANVDRKKWLDICKGIAIILVVMGHVNSSFSNSGILSDSFLLKYVGKFVYSFHMPLFFILSGFGFGLSKKATMTREIKKRVCSLGIPYLIFSVLLGGVR